MDFGREYSRHFEGVRVRTETQRRFTVTTTGRGDDTVRDLFNEKEHEETHQKQLRKATFFVGENGSFSLLGRSQFRPTLVTGGTTAPFRHTVPTVPRESGDLGR